MSLETRSSSALFKRAEQLKRWEESETNREPIAVNGRERKIKFSAGCVFLAACKAGDKEEIQRLLKKGADIDTSDVDGLSALHQACIDDNLDLVEFLVENGADVNRGDNEGWTPLHATASCGFISIAKYLIENGANVAAVNNDGELPMDVAESNEMEDMLQQQIDERGIDAENARTEEERLMMTDAKNWLSNGDLQEKVHPKTGATALHVAAAKGYLKVMDILLKAGADVDARDLDGWTPLHAASHWGQKEACEILVENLCDMTIKNCVGQTPFDVAENDIVRLLEDLRKKQDTLPKENIINRRKNIQRKPPPQEETIISDSKKDKNIEPVKPKVPEVQQVELKIQPEPTQNQSTVEKKNRVNREETTRLPSMPEVNKTVPTTPAPSAPPKQTPVTEGDESGVPSWRRSGSFRNRLTTDPPKQNLTLRISEKETQPKVNQPVAPVRTETPLEVGLRRTQSFEGDEKFYRRYCELRAKINAGNSCPALHATPMRSASLKEKHFARRGQVREESRLLGGSASPNTTASPTTTTPTSPTSTSPQSNNQVRRSFVPPVRDEESETQRKAHAKRVRETRRSTQGVTLEEIKSAEQLVKKKQQQLLQQATQQLNNSEFMLEDARKANENASDVVVRKTAVVTPVTETGDTTVTLPLRKKTEDKESENDSRTAQATQAAIQRRRRPKRRSTGVVHVDMDEIDPDRQNEGGTGGSDDSLSLNNSESGGEQSETSSRLNSVSNEDDKEGATANGEIDYKKLYEQSLIINDRLRDKLKTTEDELSEAKALAEKNAALIRSSLTESERRERRAMERKLSEMEEELKQLEQLKCENQRLKDENGALIRVISKLSK